MAWAERRGERYRGMYRDALGRKRTAGWSTSKRRARALAEEEEANLRHGSWFDPQAGKITLAHYFEDLWLPNRVISDSSRIQYLSLYRSSIKPDLGDKELRKITTGDIQRWVAKMEREGVSAGTIRDRYELLKVCLGGRIGVSAVRDRLIQANPCIGVSLPKPLPRVVNVYSVEEVDKLMTEIPQWFQIIPLVAADTGLRWGELMGLCVSDLTDGSLRVERTIVELGKKRTVNGTPFQWKDRPKGGKPRVVRLSPDVQPLLEAMIKERRLFGGDRLFSRQGQDGAPLRTAEWPEGVPVSRSSFRHLWQKAHQKTGMPLRRFHDLRGSHISWLLAGGADVSSVMRRAGHSNLSTTMLYVDALRDADDRALAALQATRDRARGAS